MQMSMPLPDKPRMRGVSHRAAFFASLGAGPMLVAAASSVQAAIAATIYAFTLAAMFGVSALYHLPAWGEKARLLMRRLDHSAIFLVIAGSYTPICLVALKGGVGLWLLVGMWAGALLGVARAVFWSHAPKALSALFYVLLGCVAVPFLPLTAEALSPLANGLLVAGGVLYVLGAVVYATRRPDPAPRIFGYHEVFHALTILAAACHFIAIRSVIVAS